MRAYFHRRFIEGPDVADIKSEGRASHVGRFAQKDGSFKSYTRRPQIRRGIRRYLKHQDNRRIDRFEAQADGRI